jgi:hypothetical protein
MGGAVLTLTTVDAQYNYELAVELHPLGTTDRINEMQREIERLNSVVDYQDRFIIKYGGRCDGKEKEETE